MRRRRWPLPALGVALVAVLGTTAVAVASHAEPPRERAGVRTTYLSITGAICDVELTPYLSPRQNPAVTGLAIWSLAALDLNALPFDLTPVQGTDQLSTHIEVAAVVRSATREVEATLGEFGVRGVSVELGSSADCRELPRTAESGEAAIDVAALLAEREPTGLLADADFEGFIVTSTGTVCEIALKLAGRVDPADPGVERLRGFLADLDLATLPPTADDLVMIGPHSTVDDAEAGAWFSALGRTVFEKAKEFGAFPAGMSTEGTWSCDG